MTSPITAAVHSWDVSTGVDGPGTRFVLFLAGCPLRCQYCQNPDSWHMRDGRRMTLDEILHEVQPYRRFLRVAHGGVTVSGGEPLLQSQFITRFFRQAHEWSLSTALDTSGALGVRADDELLAVTDLVLLDIKSWDGALYRRLTGRDLHPTLAFARRLAARGTPVRVRFVLVPGLTDEPDNVCGVARFAAGLGNVERVDVLPFHRLGAAKYGELGMRFPLAHVDPPDGDLVARVVDRFRDAGLVTA
jgi:pyruvate formate lyase activating enzyme